MGRVYETEYGLRYYILAVRLPERVSKRKKRVMWVSYLILDDSDVLPVFRDHLLPPGSVVNASYPYGVEWKDQEVTL